jgi:hypothetical protein
MSNIRSSLAAELVILAFAGVVVGQANRISNDIYVHRWYHADNN